jgi:hypothetical protein
LIERGYDKQAAISIGEKYGAEGVLHARMYHQELLRAHRLGFFLNRPLCPVATAEQFSAWHDQICDVVGESQAKIAMVRRAAYEADHKDCWSGVPTVPGITPLISYMDFDHEGRLMHHCITGYFTEPSFLYAHIKLGDEVATLQMGTINSDIYQLYGPCNTPVSREMTLFVGEFQQKVREYRKEKNNGKG